MGPKHRLSHPVGVESDAQDSSKGADSASAEKDRLATQQTANTSGLLDALLCTLPATQLAKPTSQLPEGSGQSLSLLEPQANASEIEQSSQTARANAPSLIDLLPSEPSQIRLAVSTTLAQAKASQQVSNAGVFQLSGLAHPGRHSGGCRSTCRRCAALRDRFQLQDQ